MNQKIDRAECQEHECIVVPDNGNPAVVIKALDPKRAAELYAGWCSLPNDDPNAKICMTVLVKCPTYPDSRYYLELHWFQEKELDDGTSLYSERLTTVKES